MGAYSLDLRRRVLASSGAGLETHEVAEKYSVSIAWVNRIKQRYRDTGEVAPKKVGRRQGSKMDDYSDRLGELIEEKPDRTIEELQELLPIKASWSTVRRAIVALGYCFKKNDSSFRKRSA